MADLHPEILALIESGPQQVAIGKDGIGVESYAMFARRVALRAVELEREEERKQWEEIMESIRRRGKP